MITFLISSKHDADVDIVVVEDVFDAVAGAASTILLVLVFMDSFLSSLINWTALEKHMARDMSNNT